MADMPEANFDAAASFRGLERGTVQFFRVSAGTNCGVWSWEYSP